MPPVGLGSVLGLSERRERVRTVENAVLLRLVRAGALGVEHRRHRLGAGVVLGAAEQALAGLGGNV